MEVVNLIKLTKLEKQVLVALLEGKPKGEYDYYPDEGSDVKGIAKILYGSDVFGCERRGGRICMDLQGSVCYAVKASLSRTLKQLFRKGLVKRCKPIYASFWVKANPEYESGGYYTRRIRYLRAISIHNGGKYRVEEIQCRELPERCHVWFMLTDEGKEQAGRLGDV